ncbi:MAG: hypothetical protein CSA66_03925 [Proteobacteria bacterium]|nr:MAG: hypothetical protein CSA66_03925 [Pseudomonadota bacterium]
MYPSRRTIVFVAAGVALATLPVLVAPGLWVVWLFFWTLLLLLLAVDGVLVPRGADISHEVTLPDTLFMGEERALDLSLSVRGRPVVAQVKLDLSETLAQVPIQRAALDDAPTRLRFALAPLRRGAATVEAVWLRYAGPFGLIERTVRVPLDAPLDAVPNIRGVRRLALEFFSPKEFRMGLRIEQYAGDGSEFDSLREFMPGLDHRAIDWKASARHTQLLVRKFRAERNRQVVIAVDAGRLMAEPLAGLPRLDHAIHAGLLLAYFSVRAGDRVGLYSFAERPKGFAEPRAGMPAFRAMLKLSGGISYADGETNYTLGLTDLMGRLTRRSLVVVLTDFVDTITAELMVDNVQRLAKRHLVVFVSLRDPLLDDISAAEPRHLLALERAVVAESFLRERELVIKRLRNSGAYCIDTTPDQMGVQLVNRYLEIKRREMI